MFLPFIDPLNRYYDTYLPFLLEACNDENSDVRQAAVYGIGVCAEFGGSVFRPLVGGIYVITAFYFTL